MVRVLHTPSDRDLGLVRIANNSGISISVLPNGQIFAIEHEHAAGRTMVNQLLGSPAGGGVGRLFLRAGGTHPFVAEIYGPNAKVEFGASADRFVWQGETDGFHHRVTLWLHPRLPVWLWDVSVEKTDSGEAPCDIILAQDLGLGPRGFLMNNEAYASQYIDCHIARHPRFGPILMHRQNLEQYGDHPWIAHGCFEGAASFATDGIQLFDAEFRSGGLAALPSGGDLPGVRLQREAACAILQSRRVDTWAGAQARWTFFASYEPSHPLATEDADMARADAAEEAAQAFTHLEIPLQMPTRSLLQDAPPLAVIPLSAEAVSQNYPERLHEEWRGEELLSFFTPDGVHNRHVVLREKERQIKRRHGTLLRTGQSLLPDEKTLCATCWMHGVFGAQLTIGNTSFHKLFTVARDANDAARTGGLRILADTGEGWRLLTAPSVFEMGLSDCRWVYLLADRTITVHAAASGDDPAMQWEIAVDGPPCRFLVFGQLALGEHEYGSAGKIEISNASCRVRFRPDPGSLWGQSYPDAVYHLVTSTPGAVDALGGAELLAGASLRSAGAYVAMRTHPACELRFAITGSLRNATEAEDLAAKYAAGVAMNAMLDRAAAFWRHVTKDRRFDDSALDTMHPWLAHNAVIHLSVPHGLEQYGGAAWGTRDLCQGPVEFLLALGHAEPVREILKILFAQQHWERGDWPQWFMLEPYSQIRAGDSHGDVILWPLKALCDYVEATKDRTILDEPAAWLSEDGTAKPAPIAVHVEKLLETVCTRFIPGTALLRYGEGDWNDTLQPADPAMRDRLVSSWTCALMFDQVQRYAKILRQRGEFRQANDLATLAGAIRAEFNRYLIRDGVVAGYALFAPGRGTPELLLHPSDRRTGVSYSLIPMTCAITGGLFTPEQARRHFDLIREHLLFPDGVRLMDKPLAYRGGVETIFRRAETSAFFGRETGLMYVHAHLRYCEAAGLLWEQEALRNGLKAVNPITAGDVVPQASLRQRNAYFTSSDAAFNDRYEACSRWDDVKSGRVELDGGWRIYSSGPGLFVLLINWLGEKEVFADSQATLSEAAMACG